MIQVQCLAVESQGILWIIKRRYVQLGWFRDSGFDVVLLHPKSPNVIAMEPRAWDDVVFARPGFPSHEQDTSGTGCLSVPARC